MDELTAMYVSLYFGNTPVIVNIDDDNPDEMYMGIAEMYTTNATDRWIIIRYKKGTEGVEKKYAYNANNKFDRNVWTNRKSLNYA